MTDQLSPSAHKILAALEYEPLSERDLFIRLRPMDRMALYHTLRKLVSDGRVLARDEGRLPGSIVTRYRLHRLSAVCPTCGEPPESVDAGPCDGLSADECARRHYSEHAAQDDADYMAGLAREASRSAR